MSKDLESRGVSETKRDMLEQLDVDVGKGYEKEIFKVIIYLVVEGVILSYDVILAVGFYNFHSGRIICVRGI